MSEPNTEKENLTVNAGDRISDEPETVEEKAEQIAVDAWDPAGHETVPTYFVAEDQETGEKKALHHVKDAEEISDVIRQARTDEEGNRKWW